jgi:quinol monooxygenase YgiN
MVDVNRPVENPSFVMAMNELLATPSPASEAAFLEELRKAHFLAPVAITPQPQPADETGKTTLQESTTIAFQMITNDAQQNFFLLFTDWEELRKWRNEPHQQTLIVTFEDLSAMILHEKDTSSGLVLNPYGQNLLLEKDRIALLSGKAVARPYTVKQETKVLLGEPKDYPHALVEAMKQHMKTVKEVKKAYLLLMVKDDEQSFLVVVDFRGDRKRIFDGIGSVAVPLLGKGQFLDMVPAEDKLGQDAIRGKKPFYSRGIFGF